MALTAAGLSVALASPVAAAPNYLTPSGSFDYSNFYGVWRPQGDPLSSTVACGAGWNLVKPEAQVR